MKRLALSMVFGMMLISGLTVSSPALAWDHHWHRGYPGIYAPVYGGGYVAPRFHHWHRGW